MYSPNVGFTKRTREELVKIAYESWKRLTGSTDSYQQFQGTNVHLFLNMFFDVVESQEDDFSEIQAKQFDYWEKNNLSIQSSFGASYEGWQAVFGPICTGLDIIGNMEDPTIKPGEIAIYFDNLTGTEDEIKQAFLRCKNLAEPTIRGSENIQITYSNGQTREYNYNNLLPENYTWIDAQINVSYVKRGLQYKDSDFVDYLKTRFNTVNRINRNFYPEEVLDVSPFEGVADFVVKTKIDGDQDWVDGIRTCQVGNKFTLRNVEVRIV